MNEEQCSEICRLTDVQWRVVVSNFMGEEIDKVVKWLSRHDCCISPDCQRWGNGVAYWTCASTWTQVGDGGEYGCWYIYERYIGEAMSDMDEKYSWGVCTHVSTDNVPTMIMHNNMDCESPKIPLLKQQTQNDRLRCHLQWGLPKLPSEYTNITGMERYQRSRWTSARIAKGVNIIAWTPNCQLPFPDSTVGVPSCSIVILEQREGGRGREEKTEKGPVIVSLVLLRDRFGPWISVLGGCQGGQSKEKY
jgi:hypothetical protein